MAPDPQPGKQPPYMVRMEIDGRPSLKMDLLYDAEEDEASYSFPTATVCVNAIPDVVAAPPGLLQEKVFGSWRAPSS